MTTTSKELRKQMEKLELEMTPQKSLQLQDLMD